MTPEARAVDCNLRAAMRCYALAAPAGELREFPGVTLASTGANYAVFNSAMLTSPVDNIGDAGRRLHLARLYFESRELGWSLWLSHTMLGERLLRKANSLLVDLGMQSVAQPPGMYLRELPPFSRARLDVTVRAVADERSMFDFADLAATIFSLPYPFARLIYASPAAWRSGMDGYVAYHDGCAVSIVTVVSTEGVAGVYSLGTLPQHRGKGYGETILRHALQCSAQRRGDMASALQATHQGMALYKRLGYREVSLFSVHVAEIGGRRE